MSAPSASAARVRVLPLVLRRGLALLAAAGALPLAAGCASAGGRWDGSPAWSTTHTETVQDAQSLVVENQNGSIVVKRELVGVAMRIDAKVRCAAGSEADAKARAEGAKLVATRDPDGKVHVRVEFPQRDGGSFPQDAASIEVRVPMLNGIEATTTNGRIEVGGFRGPLTLRTSNGSVDVDGNEGPVNIQTSNGKVSAVGVGAPAVVRTSNGGVTVTLAPSATGNVDVTTSNGPVSVNLPGTWEGTVSADTSNGGVKLEGTGRARNLSVQWDKGSMELGDAAKATATVKTSNGRVRVSAGG